MRRNLTLSITSLLSILLLSFHLAQDALHAPPGSQAAGPGNFAVIVTLALLLWGTVMLAGRRSGYVIQLLGAVIALGMPYLHLKGAGVGTVDRPGGNFLFMWTLLALGVFGIFCGILSARALWSTFRRAPG
jgi:hypothetical protein